MTDKEDVKDSIHSGYQDAMNNSKQKQVAKEAFMKGYKAGQDVEELREVTIRAAESHFERWWEMNQE